MNNEGNAIKESFRKVTKAPTKAYYNDKGKAVAAFRSK